MTLTKAFEMTVEYLGETKDVKVDKEGYMCLNDMAQFFPNKNVKEWLTNRNTKDFILVMEKFLNGGDSTLLKIEDFGSRGGVPKGLKAIKTKSGRYGGGTFAQETLALKFAMWLSPEFELEVLLSYQNGTQLKQDWNMARILACHNYKIMSQAVKNDHEVSKPYHYSNEARMLNRIVFGKPDKEMRDSASEQELNLIAQLEGHNTTMIALGMNYQERKEKLPILIVKDLKSTQGNSMNVLTEGEN